MRYPVTHCVCKIIFLAEPTPPQRKYSGLELTLTYLNTRELLLGEHNIS